MQSFSPWCSNLSLGNIKPGDLINSVPVLPAEQYLANSPMHVKQGVTSQSILGLLEPCQPVVFSKKLNEKIANEHLHQKLQSL